MNKHHNKNEITLPWPHKELSPNARVFWAAKYARVKLYRSACYYITKQSGIKVKDEAIDLWITFNPPDKRRRDLDNCIASIKSGLDGLADALGVDDRRFRLHTHISDKIEGSVTVRIGKEEK